MSPCKADYVSFEHGSASDGEGLRSVLFLHGCNLRCPFCHNPETLYGPPKQITSDEAARVLARYVPYLSGGGLTLSGGEPFLQPEFCIELAARVHEFGLTVIAETNGLIASPSLVSALDGVRLDVKTHSGEDADTLISRYAPFLDLCRAAGVDVLLTNVLVPSVNDSRQSLSALNSLRRAFPFCRGVKLLPFRKLCISKYERLGRPFPFSDVPEAEPSDLTRALRFLK